MFRGYEATAPASSKKYPVPGGACGKGRCRADIPFAYTCFHLRTSLYTARSHVNRCSRDRKKLRTAERLQPPVVSTRDTGLFRNRALTDAPRSHPAMKPRESGAPSNAAVLKEAAHTSRGGAHERPAAHDAQERPDLKAARLRSMPGPFL